MEQLTQDDGGMWGKETSFTVGGSTICDNHYGNQC